MWISTLSATNFRTFNGTIISTVLPFRLSSACYLYTKMLRPRIRIWRGRWLKAIIYLDDGIVAVKGKERAIRDSALVKSDLENARFVVNIQKKSVGTITCC